MSLAALFFVFSISFYFNICLNNFILVRYFFFFPFFPFLLSHVADRVLVLWLSVGPEPLRWESRVQDVGPPETSWHLIISIGESSPRYLHLNAETQLHSMTSKLDWWTTHDKQLARQEHNPTY